MYATALPGYIRVVFAGHLLAELHIRQLVGINIAVLVVVRISRVLDCARLCKAKACGEGRVSVCAEGDVWIKEGL